jgi:hypothetical protein
LPPGIQSKFLSPDFKQGIESTIAGGQKTPMDILNQVNKGYNQLTLPLAASTDPRAAKIGEWATGMKKEKMAEVSREAARKGVSQFWQKWNGQPADLDAMEQDLSLLKSNLGESKDLESLNAVDSFIKNKRSEENAATMAGQKTETQKRLETTKEEDALSKFITQEMPLYRRGTQEGKAKGGFDAASKTINELNKGNINGYELQDIQNTLNIVENTGALNRTIGELLSKLGDPKDLLNENQIAALRKVAENDLRSSSNILNKFFNTVRKSKSADFSKYPNQAQAFDELVRQYTAPTGAAPAKTTDAGTLLAEIRARRTGK